MPRRSQPVAQRIREVATQISRLREHLSLKTRNRFSSDSQYRSWLEKTTELLSEFENELSVLMDPGEYAQLPPAVVAQELGTTTSKVRQLIKAGEIFTTGKPAHEYINREELEVACSSGLKELLRRLLQEPAEIFEESIKYLHQNHLELAERVSLRLTARETSVGIYSFTYETALLLARADLDGIDYRLEFVRNNEIIERESLLRNLRRLLSGMTFESVSAQAIAERLLSSSEETYVIARRVSGSEMDELQQAAIFIATFVCDEISQRWKRHHLLRWEMDELRRVVSNAVYSSLYARESYRHLATSKEFVDSITCLIPRLCEPPTLVAGLVKDYDSGDG